MSARSNGLSSGWFDVPLPHGLWLDGARQGDAAIRPVTGADELFLAEDAAGLAKAERVTGLLQRCVGRIGAIAAPTAEHVRALSVGDREALLLHLRRLSFGSRIDCVVTCPAEGCGEAMDVGFDVSDLLFGDAAADAPVETLALPEHGWTVAFRVPDGADQEAAAALARRDAEGAARLMLDRCVVSVTDAAGTAVDRAAALPALATLLPERMSRRDPQAEIRLALDCPACGHAFAAIFDTADFMAAELKARGRSILDEVHLIARHYHWSEADILALPAGRRRRYLAMIADDLSAARGSWEGRA